LGEAGGRSGGQAVGRSDDPPEGRLKADQIGWSDRLTARPPAPPTAAPPACNRCGFEVPGRARGCKNPCANCGTVYPLGDCSD
jgi:hypothetical protein